MKHAYLLDQSLSWRVGRALERAGYDVVHTNQVGLQDATDARILDYCVDHDRVLISRDGDFARMISAAEAPARWRSSEVSLVEVVQHQKRGLATPDEQSQALLRHLPAAERNFRRGVVVEIDRLGSRSRTLELQTRQRSVRAFRNETQATRDLEIDDWELQN